MGIVRVAVIEHAGKGNKREYLVRPSVVFLKKGDTLRVLNYTERDVKISRAPAGPGATPHEFLGLPTKDSFHAVSKGGVLKLRAGKDVSHWCRYRVTVNGVVARGDSDPVIIIDNP